MQPVTKYVRCGNIHIAYQVFGDGLFDLIYVPGWVSHVELAWEDPEQARFLSRLASFCRVITFDKRGTGLSDRVSNDKLPTLEERMEDLKAVMDAAGSKEAALFGFSEGGNLCALFAATYPQRTKALVLFGVFAKRIKSPDYPWAPSPESRAQEYAIVEKEWGNEMDLQNYVPSRMHDKEFIKRLATYFRRAASPSAAVTLLRMNTEIDIREILPLIRVPTLLLYRTHDHEAQVEEGRWIASRIPNARFVELEGQDHIPWVSDQDAVLDHVQEFLTGVKPTRDFDRILVTILFTDIVGSTELAAKIGDRAWKALLDQHNSFIRQTIHEFRGEEIDTTGDGFLVAFDGPARAVRCALAISQNTSIDAFRIRTGLHTGEVIKIGSKMSGLSIHLTERVLRHSGPGEVVITGAVKDLVPGAGFAFEDRGVHALKGVPGKWHLFAVTDTTTH